jgi:hypothetical protein
MLVDTHNLLIGGEILSTYPEAVSLPLLNSGEKSMVPVAPSPNSHLQGLDESFVHVRAVNGTIGHKRIVEKRAMRYLIVCILILYGNS